MTASLLRWLTVPRAMLGIVAIVVAAFVGRDMHNEHLLDVADVRVVHADGTPVPGVRVRCEWMRRNGGRGLAILPPSGADGSVSLERVGENEHPALWQYQLQARIPGVPAVWNVLAETTRIVVPPLATLEVVAFDVDGQPWSGDAVRAAVFDLRPDSSPTRIELLGGRARIPVATGTKLRVEVNIHAHRFEVDCDAPAEGGGRRELRLQLPTDTVVATGRLVDASGQPQSERVVVGLQALPGRPSAFPLTPAADGSFRMICGQGRFAPFDVTVVAPDGRRTVASGDDTGGGLVVNLGDLVLR